TLLAALLLAACGKDTPVPPPSANDPHALLQAEMEKGTMDFSRVVVVRLNRGGKMLEVPSVNPTTVAEATLNGAVAKTIFRINDQRAALVMFSRDLPNAKSFKTEMPFAELQAKGKFTFPVVQADGRLKEEDFSLNKIATPTQ
ncbi:MAG TPA: hypothetical protein VI279_00250, partial [Rhodocyclaceae bacterium]